MPFPPILQIPQIPLSSSPDPLSFTLDFATVPRSGLFRDSMANENGAPNDLVNRKASVIQLEHREDDDRADVAKGKNSDTIDRKYWLSVNYIGSLFAIGMAFMGGIGGQLNSLGFEVMRPNS